MLELNLTRVSKRGSLYVAQRMKSYRYVLRLETKLNAHDYANPHFKTINSLLF